MAYNGIEMKDACRMTAVFLQSDDLVDMAENYGKQIQTDDGLVTDNRLDCDPDGILLAESVRTALFDMSSDGFVKTSRTVVKSVDSKIDMSALCDNAPVFVLSVTRDDGTPVEFSYTPLGICVDGDGEFAVTYATRENGGQRVGDAVDINGHIGLYAIAYCAARNYCLVTGRYDEAGVWDQRYNNEIEKLRLRRRSCLPQRRWA